MDAGEVAIEARGLAKRYGDLVAVAGIDFVVRRGECVGFLGPNGAGKTTTVRMVSAFTPIDGGTVEVLGLSVAARPRDVKRLLGVCPQEDNLDPDLSVERNLLVYARYFDVPVAEARARAEDLLRRMDLAERRGARVTELSGGLKRRLVLARALLNHPKVLLLDEPTTGLDPQARHAIWQRVRALKAEGTTVLLTTHYMEEAEALCDRVVLMDRGRILLDGPPAELIRSEVGAEVLEVWDHGEEVVRFVGEHASSHETASDRLYAYLPPGADAGRAFGERFPHQPHVLRRATLEDVFLRRTGRGLRS